MKKSILIFSLVVFALPLDSCKQPESKPKGPTSDSARLQATIPNTTSQMQNGPTHEINTDSSRPTDYYAWLTTLSVGPFTSLENPTSDDSVGYLFRVGITTSEIYNTIIIEKLTFGSEGSRARIAFSHAVDMRQFQDAFHVDGEMSGVQIVKWMSPWSFVFSLHRVDYSVSNLENSKVTITKLATVAP